MTARNLRAVEQGNPGHRREEIESRLTAPPERPTEPDWSVIFPGDNLKAGNLRAAARSEWRGVVEPLFRLGILSGSLDSRALMDYATCCARLDEAERDITARGLTVPGLHGVEVRNPNVTSATQYRTQMRSLMTKLGLSPHDRAGLKRPDPTEGDDDPWSGQRSS
jgi:P27 family predicted phage terminase small subunit